MRRRIWLVILGGLVLMSGVIAGVSGMALYLEWVLSGPRLEQTCGRETAQTKR